jgi:hypothetical protein
MEFLNRINCENNLSNKLISLYSIALFVGITQQLPTNISLIGLNLEGNNKIILWFFIVINIVLFIKLILGVWLLNRNRFRKPTEYEEYIEEKNINNEHQDDYYNSEEAFHNSSNYIINIYNSKTTRYIKIFMCFQSIIIPTVLFAKVNA